MAISLTTHIILMSRQLVDEVERKGPQVLGIRGMELYFALKSGLDEFYDHPQGADQGKPSAGVYDLVDEAGQKIAEIVIEEK